MRGIVLIGTGVAGLERLIAGCSGIACAHDLPQHGISPSAPTPASLDPIRIVPVLSQEMGDG